MGVKRRYQFIEKKQQLRFAVTLSLYVLFFPFLIAALILSPFSDVLVGPEAEEIRSAVFEIAEFFLYHWDLVLITLGFIAYASILFSHKIFGPIRRFESALIQKRWNPDGKVFCTLRKGDYFKDFSVMLQDFLDSCQVTPPVISETFVGESEISTEASEGEEKTGADTEEPNSEAPNLT